MHAPPPASLASASLPQEAPKRLPNPTHPPSAHAVPLKIARLPNIQDHSLYHTLPHSPPASQTHPKKSLPTIPHSSRQPSADVNHCSARGTPLMAAAAAGDCESVTLLLDSGAHVDAEARDGLTALCAAVREKQPEAVRLLLRRGADPNRTNKDGVSAVDLAQEKVLPEIYSLLMQSSITQAADEALRASEQRQAAAREEIEESVRRAKEDAQEEMARGRAETADKVAALRNESEELLKRLGLKR